jgi:hypothetical protein
MLTLLVKEFLKKHKRELEFLGVGQKATIARIWNVGLFGMRYKVGLFVERSG